MSSTQLVAATFGFAAGALVVWAIASWLRGREIARLRVEGAERLATAEATAVSEIERRRELELRLEQAQRAAADLDRRLAVADERVVQAREMIEEQKNFLHQARKELEDSFQALAGAALRGSTEQFLSLAEQRLATSRSEAAADLEGRKQEIAALLNPLQENLQRLGERTDSLERARVDAYSRIDQQVQMLAEATLSLQEKTTSLDTALRGSQVRGRWGEIALRNIAELSGMAEHCDFEEQETLPDGRRPDMTVRLPGDRRIAVDAKAPLSAYLEACEATTDAARDAALDRHVKDLRQHIRALAARDYASSLGHGVDLVVMFLPGDPFLAAAFARDPGLQIEALRSQVLIATPTTLVALLRTVAIYWQQRAMAENARAIASTASELYERAAKFGEELGAVGRGLTTALEAYNRAVGSFDRRLVPMGRQLEEMKVTEQARRELRAPEPIDDIARGVQS